MDTKRILFVCLGNICRSPMAEGIFRDKAKELNLDIFFDSCGTGGWHAGEQPDKRAQACIESHGSSISDLRARQFVASDFQNFDVIYTMDESNHRDILALAKNESDQSKVRLLLNEAYPGENMSVPDPYFGDGDGFEHVYNLISDAAKKALSKLNQ